MRSVRRGGGRALPLLTSASLPFSLVEPEIGGRRSFGADSDRSFSSLRSVGAEREEGEGGVRW